MDIGLRFPLGMVGITWCLGTLKSAGFAIPDELNWHVVLVYSNNPVDGGMHLLLVRQHQDYFKNRRFYLCFCNRSYCSFSLQCHHLNLHNPSFSEPLAVHGRQKPKILHLSVTLYRYHMLSNGLNLPGIATPVWLCRNIHDCSDMYHARTQNQQKQQIFQWPPRIVIPQQIFQNYQRHCIDDFHSSSLQHGI